jgi:hypothetical protein
LEELGVDTFDVFKGHLVVYCAIGVVQDNLEFLWKFWFYFLPFWFVVPRKIWQPCHGRKQISGFRLYVCIILPLAPTLFLLPSKTLCCGFSAGSSVIRLGQISPCEQAEASFQQ